MNWRIDCVNCGSKNLEKEEREDRIVQFCLDCNMIQAGAPKNE